MGFDLHTLFRNHSKEIVRSLRRRGLSAETAADITQDTFVRLMTAQTPVEAIANPKAFLFQISRNLCIDIERRQRVLPFVENPDEILGAIVDEAPSPEQAVMSRQELAIVQAALDRVPEGPREAFLARLVDGKTFDEIGRTLGVSPQTVSSYVLKVMMRLKQALDQARQSILALLQHSRSFNRP